MNKKFEELIKDTWAEVINEHEMTAMPHEDEFENQLEFSCEFEEKLNERLEKIGQEDTVASKEEFNRKHIFIRKHAFSRAAVYLSIIAVILISTITVYGYKSDLIRRIFDTTTDISLIYDPEKMKDEIDIVYSPGYIPEGYEMIFNDKVLTRVLTRYANSNTDEIVLGQYSSRNITSIDNEDTLEEDVTINGNEGIYTLKHGQHTLIWSDYGYLFNLIATDPEITKEELIKIAESIQ